MTDTAPGVQMELTEVLGGTARHAVGLLAEQGDAPRVVRVRAEQVVIEFEWRRGPDVAPPAAVPVTPSPPAGAASAAPPAAAPAAPSADADLYYVCAPSVGVFYRGPEPGSPPYVEVGDIVEPGQQVGIVEVMKLMIPVEAQCAGTITAVLRADAEPVEYDDHLVAVDPR
jgi:acetyl-CoA carboxylase biotin carboxyl carrier protein